MIVSMPCLHIQPFGDFGSTFPERALWLTRLPQKEEIVKIAHIRAEY